MPGYLVRDPRRFGRVKLASFADLFIVLVRIFPKVSRPFLFAAGVRSRAALAVVGVYRDQHIRKVPGESFGQSNKPSVSAVTND